MNERWEPDVGPFGYSDEEAELADLMNLLDLTLPKRKDGCALCTRYTVDAQAYCWTCFKKMHPVPSYSRDKEPRDA